jgi:lysophospholipase L1-like esterase
MLDKNKSYSVTEEHATGFGIIISIFAKLEHQMCIAAAGILGSDLGTASILLSTMQYRQKWQTLNHLNMTIGVNGATSPGLRDLLNRIDKHSTLRNLIAHALWTEGRRPESIKPMQIRTRSDTLKMIGHDDSEKDYTVDDLRDAAKALDAVDQEFSRYLQTSGLEARVKVKLDELEC